MISLKSDYILPMISILAKRDMKVLLFIIILLGLSNAAMAKFGNQNHLPSTETTAQATCLCDGKKLVTRPINGALADRIFETDDAAVNGSFFVAQPRDVRHLFEKCEDCVVKSKTCDSAAPPQCFARELFMRSFKKNSIDLEPLSSDETNEATEENEGKESSEEVPLFHSIEEADPAEETISNSTPSYPIHVRIPPGAAHDRHWRVKRQYPNTCSYPNGMATAQMECTSYPSRVICVTTCAQGYAQSDGNDVLKMHCYKSEGIWYPHGFDECVPYVDCGVTMATGGTAKCVTSTVTSPAQCMIECDYYEDKPPVPPTLYSCMASSGQWVPPLPFCALPGSGMRLVPRAGIARRLPRIFCRSPGGCGDKTSAESPPEPNKIAAKQQKKHAATDYEEIGQ